MIEIVMNHCGDLSAQRLSQLARAHSTELTIFVEFFVKLHPLRVGPLVSPLHFKYLTLFLFIRQQLLAILPLKI